MVRSSVRAEQVRRAGAVGNLIAPLIYGPIAKTSGPAVHDVLSEARGRPVEETMAQGVSEKWTAQDVPDQHGRTVVITGANSGIGLETAKVLAARGAGIVLGGRDPGRTA